MLRISSDRLAVEMLEPGSKLYARTRFDWTGFITQVTLDGAHTFCVPESPRPGEGTGGIGLCNEFGSSAPVGYDDARPGDYFPKIGIGLLKRIDDSEYSPFCKYPLQPFPIGVETARSSVTFTVDPVPVRGYAVRFVKVVTADGDRVLVDYTLENVGEKRIVTQEYNHNFVGIDDTPFGTDYELKFAFDPVPDSEPAAFKVDGSAITWPAPPKKAYCHALKGFEGKRTPFWELKLRTSGLAMREQPSFDWARCIFFGTPHLASTEVFVDIAIDPGDSQQWRREYSFSVARP